MKYKLLLPLSLLLLFFSLSLLNAPHSLAQVEKTTIKKKSNSKRTTTLYGTASFYAQKFQGKRTASGETFDHMKFTAACNALPLGTWVKVTNLSNNKTVLVRTNDRLHVKTSRLLDLTKAAARRLGYLNRGLTRVKIEVLSGKPT